MRITNPNKLTKGKEIFVVRVSPQRHSDIRIEKFIVTKTPDEFDGGKKVEGERVEISDTIHILTVDLVKCKFVGITMGTSHLHTKTSFSLKDAGVVKNNFNDHRTFDSLESAKRYVCDFIGMNFAQSRGELNSAYERAMGIIQQ